MRKDERRRRQEDMLKELIRNESNNSTKVPEVSPVEQALKQFEEENGYKFLDMVNDLKIRKKHLFKNMQKKDNEDDDFLNEYQDQQGDRREYD
ncbi:hypothetical protein ACR6EC_05570 [Bacillus subtilis]|uniref:hypothetical protein n=1 Tax=Bacillus subtilis TaxID=1423 RepID=UPI003EB80196